MSSNFTLTKVLGLGDSPTTSIHLSGFEYVNKNFGFVSSATSAERGTVDQLYAHSATPREIEVIHFWKERSDKKAMGSENLLCGSPTPIMKRGFLNSKKIKQQPLYEGCSNAAVTVKEATLGDQEAGAADASTLEASSSSWRSYITDTPFPYPTVPVEGTKGICKAFSQIRI